MLKTRADLPASLQNRPLPKLRSGESSLDSLQEGKKYQRAVELGSDQVVVVHGTPQFYGLLQQYSDQHPQPTAAASASKQPAAPPVLANPYAKTLNNPYAKKAFSSTSVTAVAATAANVNPYTKIVTTTSTSTPGNKTDGKPRAKIKSLQNRTDMNQLWVDRYKPTSSREILGNEAAVRQLQRWLQSWESVFNKESKVGKAYSGPQGPWKAALLSGPPGIGSTFVADGWME